MSSDPFYNFFDSINNEVQYFNRLLDPDFRPYRQGQRRTLTDRDQNEDLNSQLVRRDEYQRPRLFNDLNDWFNNDLSLFPVNNLRSSATLAPPVDILDHDKNYELKVTVPGVKGKENINLEYHKEKNQIVVTGEIPATLTEDNKGKVKVQERASGKFRRVIGLPDSPGIDADNIKADYSGGILTLTVPKLEPAEEDAANKVQKIEITSQESWNN
ncbi:hypothetical protein KAFR_0H01340 [Kazachstania africana CBS 2517]|uniref:SHSP domain-containing protein n=1 Tax=Kazachstania africana (strain ATCC 22294 / BCRC 22015 / CBS 2517 / CECT 1963 / NBRC 1671 / NRRL Y-8276) TaxID=1071382 RepID=H2AYY8_KAZAF|nr:hypothetical protein KAFR_0H01340 [Kazachstania africana CBS 2517]CCF59544.1 hypothetical protein KAFR_0H01340 [Kazachstania africana CBS 2517]